MLSSLLCVELGLCLVCHRSTANASAVQWNVLLQCFRIPASMSISVFTFKNSPNPFHTRQHHGTNCKTSLTFIFIQSVHCPVSEPFLELYSILSRASLSMTLCNTCDCLFWYWIHLALEWDTNPHHLPKLIQQSPVGNVYSRSSINTNKTNFIKVYNLLGLTWSGEYVTYFLL